MSGKGLINKGRRRFYIAAYRKVESAAVWITPSKNFYAFQWAMSRQQQIMNLKRTGCSAKEYKSERKSQVLTAAKR